MNDHETRSLYERTHIGLDLERGTRPAVLVVDFSRGFTHMNCPIGADLSAEVASTRQLLNAARFKGLPIVFTTIGYGSDLSDAGIWIQKMPGLGQLRVGGEWVEIDSRLDRRPDEMVILKKGASAFFGTNLTSILISQRVDTVVLCGATTSGCIRATAIDLLQYGFPTLIPRECVGDRARGPHEANLFDMQAKYADVISLGEALAYVESTGSGVSPNT